MISNLLDAQSLLSPYEPQVPIEQLVEALNRWYHESEVVTYDRQHAEIRHQLPPRWREMTKCAIQLVSGVARSQGGVKEANMVPRSSADMPDGGWRILDFGCGTGFEATQLLGHLGADSISHLCCYDLSPEMLDRCRDRVRHRFPNAQFTSCLQEAIDVDRPYHLLATNSVLHHLPSPEQTLQTLSTCLEDDAVWLAGHEPSSRFYKNAQCCEAYHHYLRHYRRRRWFSPRAYVGFAQRRTGMTTTPARAAAVAAVDAGMLNRLPAERVVSRLVDLHVAHSREEANAGRGFDFREMERHYAGTWQLRWQQTYSFMGPFYEERLPARWKAIVEQLAAAFPLDGANFCAVWQRVPSKP